MIPHRKDPPTLNDLVHVLGLGRENVEVVVELGVDKGGSLRLWDDLFRPKVIVGLDNNVGDGDLLKTCEELNVKPVLIYFDQRDLESVRYARGRVGEIVQGADLIIDDCCHDAAAMERSLLAFWSLLKDGGIYVVEDWQVDFGVEFARRAAEIFLDLPGAVEMVVRYSMIVFVKGYGYAPKRAAI